jgi:hypothetical protein
MALSTSTTWKPLPGSVYKEFCMSLTNSIASATPNLVNAQWAFRNRIINGACNIAQRGSMAYLYATSGYSGPDRFTAGNNMPGTGEFTQSLSVVTYDEVEYFTVLQTVDTAVAAFTGNYSWTGIQQRIEGFNCYDLKGQQAVLSFVFYTNVTGTYSISIADGAAAYTYVAAFEATADVPVKVIIPVSMLPSTLTVLPNAEVGLYVSIGGLSGTAQPNMNAWEAGNYAMAAGATNWAMTAGNFIALSQLQLEAGTVATPFENRPIGTEFAMCQRYYQLGGGAWGAQNSTTTGYVEGQFMVPMRVTPTVTFPTSVEIYNGTNITATLSEPNLNNVTWIAMATFTASGAEGWAMSITNGSGATVLFSAEL